MDHSLSTGVYCTVHELLFEGLLAKDLDLHRRYKKNTMLVGGRRANVRGRGMEFFESRPYVPQDEMRTIDWKKSARFSKLFTKIFIAERDRPIYIVVDLRPSMFFGSRTCFKSVLACRIAARLATAALAGQARIAGVVFDQREEKQIPLGQSSKTLAAFFGVLAKKSHDLAEQAANETAFIEEHSVINLEAVVRTLAQRIRPGSLVFLLSDFSDVSSDLRHVLFKLKKKADVMAMAVFDPLEEQLPDLGHVGMEFLDQPIWFNSSESSLKQKYRSYWQEHQQRVQQLFSSLGLSYERFSTAIKPDLLLRALFMGGSKAHGR